MFPASSLSALLNLTSDAVGFVPQPNTWVRLRDPLSLFSFDEALLLCEETDGRWVAWVPDFGETLLERHQFVR
ncbi:hypothetical protein BST81_09080 [Leptolyngbya sp. 'hensonii']|uniref:hypothetical protein n=1 Tax=Leptolyngbya sp. 'hensonii' TaxID=1922337 RepID=UPI000950272A|nr:hypothetical protein [Leptolyngbya sp. 'hensonii']OLP18742.1 hypothetical protein BST81_09080 [Leptolyngbya sp. 'hensonii']